MADLPIIQFDSIILRALKLEDAGTVQRLAGDKAIADTTLAIPHPYPDGLAEKWISTHRDLFEQGRELNLAIVQSHKDSPIGCISLMNINQHHSRAELGYWVGKPFWNRGVASTAARALVEYGFETLGLNRIYAYHLTRNIPSGRVLQKIGMKYEGTLRQHLKNADCYEDIATYGILHHECSLNSS